LLYVGYLKVDKFMGRYCSTLCSSVFFRMIQTLFRTFLKKKRDLSPLKGLVHFEMEIMSSFKHHQVVSNLFEFLYFAEHYFAEDILKNVSNQTPLTSTVFIVCICLVTNFLQNIFFCVQQRKETHQGLKQLEGE